MFDEKHKKMNLLHSNHQVKKHASFSCVSRQIKITFYFKLAVNQNASISQNSKTSKSRSFRQLMSAESIRAKFLSSIFMKSTSENSAVSSYKMLFIFEDILYTSISRTSLVLYSVNRIMHESDPKCCISDIKESQQISQSEAKSDSKSERMFAEQYIDRHSSNISLMILIKKFNSHTCRRCFRVFRFNNDFHEHLRCTHLKHRHRRFAERTSRGQRLDQFWRKI